MDGLSNVIFWLLAAVALPLCLRFFYGLFLQDKEVQLKGYLVQHRSRRSHRRKVAEFVRAFNGGASIGRARVSRYTALAWALSAFLFIFGSATYVERTINSAKGVIAQSENKLAVPTVPSFSKSTEELVADIESLKKNIDQLERFGLPILWCGAVMTGVAFLYGLWVWLPRQLRLDYFEFEIQRFIRQMSALADKDARVALALAEVAVRDEATLKEFIRAANSVAASYSASDLVKRFDLWNITDSLPKA